MRRDSPGDARFCVSTFRYRGFNFLSITSADFRHSIVVILQREKVEGRPWVNKVIKDLKAPKVLNNN